MSTVPHDLPAATSPDLLATLEEIEHVARQTQLNLAAGLAVNGATGLKKIEKKASDARRHATTATPQEASR